MSAIHNTPDCQLTTFPAVFKDEDEPSVNQVISSLFSKVKSRFSTLPSSESLGHPSESNSIERTQNRVEDVRAKFSAAPAASSQLRQLASKNTTESSLTTLQSNAPSTSPRPGTGTVTSTSKPRSESSDSQTLPPGRRENIFFNGVRPSSNLSAPAPPVVSVTPATRTRHRESPTAQDNLSRGRHIRTSSITSNHRPRRGSISSLALSPSTTSLSALAVEQLDFSNVPGFPIADDARSLRTVASGKGNDSVSKIIRRLRGEGLSKQYWMADENCKECYDCKTIFTTWRRKHHCRICGQIFCGRCAPNIIKGIRFGQEGMVRVCNLCLHIMDKYDDDDDQRSVASTTTYNLSLSANAAGSDGNIPKHGPSPFAASQLFSRTHDNLNSISEHGWRNGGRYDEDRSPPGTPSEDMQSEYNAFRHEGGGRHPLLGINQAVTRHTKEAAPFRRGIDEEDHEAAIPPPSTPNSPLGDGAMSPGDTDVDKMPVGPAHPVKSSSAKALLPSVAISHVNASAAQRSPDVSTVPFPSTAQASDEYAGEGRGRTTRLSARAESSPTQPPGALRSRFPSHMSPSVLSGVLLGDPSEGNGVWRSRSDSFVAPPDMLQGVSKRHFSLMLRQAIEREGISHANDWEVVLTRLLLKMSTYVSPDVRAGDSMDPRAYVKIKKIPGGQISQSEYVDGIVITQNLADKHMPRHLISPRIMLLTFPLDYHRVENQFMSLEPLLAQERNYLKHLTKRVIDLRPHVVLVERSVSRLALDFLQEAKVAVARGVKSSGIHQVARCTQADVITSMDKLALEPRLGRCTEFRLQTFEHHLIPGFRKTYMRFEGCHSEFGCTLIVRGSDLEMLKKVKRVADFMTLAVMNMKMEACLFYDEFNILPPDPQSEQNDLLDELDPSHLSSLRSDVAPSPLSPSTHLDDKDGKRAAAGRQSEEIAKSLRPYLETALSTSASVKYSPPAPLARMGMLDRRLRMLRRQRDEEEAAQILEEEGKHHSKSAPPSFVGLFHSASGDALSSDSEPSTPMAREPGIGPFSDKPPVVDAPAPLPTFRESVLRSPEEVRWESDIAQTECEHAEQLKLWAWYCSRNTPIIRPENYQGLLYLSASVCEGQDKPCTGPSLMTHNFYMDDDCTLGQYIERLAQSAGHACPSKTCSKMQLYHFQVLVHGDIRLQIAMDQFPCPSPGMEDKIITWSYCRICNDASPTAILRDDTWKFSWAKYLEHSFYPPVGRGGFACPHDLYRDQIRYFAHRHMAIRIHNEVIDIHDVIRPSVMLQIRQETRVLLKNQEYETILHKTTAFYDSVVLRLKSFDSQVVQPEHMEKCGMQLEQMIERAQINRLDILDLLDRTYKLSPLADILALNSVYQTLQDSVVQWDVDFTDLEKAYLPSDKDLRKITTANLKRFFANQELSGFSMDRSVSSTTVSEVDESECRPDEPQAVVASDGGLHVAFPDAETATTSHIADSGDLPVLQLDRKEYCESEAATPLAEVPSTDSALLGVTRPSRRSAADDSESHDSDSTISALPQVSPAGAKRHCGQLTDESSASGMERDLPPFVSRLPRRSKPAPSVADLISRFQSASPSEDISPLHLRPQKPLQSQDNSDGMGSPSTKPKLRRGKTDGYYHSHRSSTRGQSLSDDDRSYAANASRIPTISAVKRTPSHRTSGGEQSPSPSPSPWAHARPKLQRSSTLQVPTGTPGPSRPSTPTFSSRQRADMSKVGKGKAPSRQLMDPMMKSLFQSGVRTPKRGQTSTYSTKVSTLARHFDRISRDAERDRQRRIASARGRRARPVALTRAKVSVYDNVNDAFRDDDDDDSDGADDEDDDEPERGEGGHVGESETDEVERVRKASIPASLLIQAPPADIPPPIVVQEPGPATPSVEIKHSKKDEEDEDEENELRPSSLPVSEAATDISLKDRLPITLPPLNTTTPLMSVPPTPNLPASKEGSGVVQSVHLSESEVSSGGPERSNILKTLSGLWAFNNADMTPLEYPLSAAEHVFADSRIIIREDEPTSIIAFTLATKQYRDKMRNLAHQSRSARKLETPAMDDTVVGEKASSSWDVITMEDVADHDDVLNRDAGTHLKYDFESGHSTIFCRIFFAEQFGALRTSCGCEESFLESLARCLKWDSSGGKSGSAFLKTKDDRFIAKEVSRLEMDSLTKFAPSYFEYMKQGLAHSRPTALAKIYGFFKIGFRNATTGRSLRMNVLIMENLFYERHFDRIFDLKGSMRNRLAVATGRVNQVLLDENLMELVNRQPLSMRDHSKKILRTALWNDTLFLANLNVMDYSLVVGVDSERKELVVGVVDYIRTFTWDKKLESWVKDLGGAGRGEPTIVTPKQYKARFRAAMDKYFPSVPDRWSVVQTDTLPVDDDAVQSL